MLPAVAFVLVALASCTAIRVEPLRASSLPRPHVCIERNPRVIISDFVDVLRDGFARHGISSEMYEGRPPESCEVLVNYTARQSWDIVPYMATADVEIRRSGTGERIAFAHYHLRGGGGYALTKYDGTKTKMRPVMEQLLAEYRR